MLMVMPICQDVDTEISKWPKRTVTQLFFFSMIQDDEIYYVNDVKKNSCVINSIVLNA